MVQSGWTDSKPEKKKKKKQEQGLMNQNLGSEARLGSNSGSATQQLVNHLSVPRIPDL